MIRENSGLEAFKLFMCKALKTSLCMEAPSKEGLHVLLGVPRARLLSDPSAGGRSGQKE